MPKGLLDIQSLYPELSVPARQREETEIRKMQDPWQRVVSKSNLYGGAAMRQGLAQAFNNRGLLNMDENWEMEMRRLDPSKPDEANAMLRNAVTRYRPEMVPALMAAEERLRQTQEDEAFRREKQREDEAFRREQQRLAQEKFAYEQQRDIETTRAQQQDRTNTALTGLSSIGLTPESISMMDPETVTQFFGAGLSSRDLASNPALAYDRFRAVNSNIKDGPIYEQYIELMSDADTIDPDARRMGNEMMQRALRTNDVSLAIEAIGTMRLPRLETGYGYKTVEVDDEPVQIALPVSGKPLKEAQEQVTAINDVNQRTIAALAEASTWLTELEQRAPTNTFGRGVAAVASQIPWTEQGSLKTNLQRVTEKLAVLEAMPLVKEMSAATGSSGTGFGNMTEKEFFALKNVIGNLETFIAMDPTDRALAVASVREIISDIMGKTATDWTVEKLYTPRSTSTAALDSEYNEYLKLLDKYLPGAN